MLALNLPTYPIKVIQKEGKHHIFDRIRKKYVKLTPEEWVRQHFVNYLITDKGYPAGLIANEMKIDLNNTIKRCDTVVYNDKLKPIMIVEYKAPNVEISKNTFDQIARYNMVLRVKYLIVSNGLTHYGCMIDYDKQEYTFFPEIPDYKALL